jgi:uncharacterized membrane protein YcaP (DUF421 family)
LFAALAKRLRRSFAFRNDNFATLVKGKERVLIRDGEIQWNAMRKSHIGERDLLGALCSEANVTDSNEVQKACLERSGDISVIKRDRLAVQLIIIFVSHLLSRLRTERAEVSITPTQQTP